MAKERSAAQLANDERLRQRAKERAANAGKAVHDVNPQDAAAEIAALRARLSQLERSSGQSPQIFEQSGAIGPDDARAEVIQKTSISTEGEVSSDTVFVDAISGEEATRIIDDEAFMNERVLIEVEPGAGEGAPLFIPAGHNGTTQWIQVGKPQRVKRRFLYSLLSAKHAELKSDFGKDAAGREFNRLDGVKRSTHRVIVLEDSQRGREKYREWAQLA